MSSPPSQGGTSSKHFQENFTQAMETLRILQHTTGVPMRVVQVVRHPLDVAATLAMRRTYRQWWAGSTNADVNTTQLLAVVAQSKEARSMLEGQVEQALHEVLELSIVDEHIRHLLQLDPAFTDARWLTMAHEDPIADPPAALRRLCAFFNVE